MRNDFSTHNQLWGHNLICQSTYPSPKWGACFSQGRYPKGIFRPRQAFNVSNPWQQCDAQTSTNQFLGLLDTTKIDVIAFAPVACITGVIFAFWEGGGVGRRQAPSGRGASDTRDGGKRLLASFALAVARLTKAKKKIITPVVQAITPGPRLNVEFWKKKKQKTKPTGKKGRPCLLKNKTCFERNEKTV